MENKINYEEIDEWGRSFQARKYAYSKIHPTYNVLTLKITAKGEKRLYVCDPLNSYSSWNLGFFDGHNSRELFEEFFMQKVRIWYADLLSNLNNYGFPVEEWYYKNKEKVDLFKEEMAPKKEKDDHTYIDYNYFIWAKNRYNREKDEESKVSYTIAIVAIYIIAATIISTLFFSSEYYSKTSSIMAILWIFAFIAASIWLGKKADKKLDEIYRKLSEEYNNSFSLENEVIYNQVFKNMVDREVEYLTRHCDRMLIHLIENHSSEIPEEVYELKSNSRLSSSDFVSAISLDNKKALLEKYLDKQANFAREKSIILLNRIKEEGDEAFTKDIVTPSGQIDLLITDIIKKHNISVKE